MRREGKKRGGRTPDRQYSASEVQEILREAAVSGISPIARKYGVTRRTIQRWRAHVFSAAPQLAPIVSHPPGGLGKDWIQVARETLTALMERAKAVSELEGSSLAELTKLIKVVGDIVVAERALVGEVEPDPRPAQPAEETLQ